MYADPYASDSFGSEGFDRSSFGDEEAEAGSHTRAAVDDSIFERHPSSLTGDEIANLGMPSRMASSRHPAVKTFKAVSGGVHYFGCGLNLINSNGHSVMHISAMAGDFSTIELLLLAGANPNVISRHGATPLHYAAPRGFLPVVKALLAHPAMDPNRVDAAGRTAMDLLCLQGFLHDKMWDLLEESGGRNEIPVCNAADTSMERDVNGVPIGSRARSRMSSFETNTHPLDDASQGLQEVGSTGGSPEAVRTGARLLSPAQEGHLLPLVPYEVALQLVEIDEEEGTQGVSVVDFQ